MRYFWYFGLFIVIKFDSYYYIFLLGKKILSGCEGSNGNIWRIFSILKSKLDNFCLFLIRLYIKFFFFSWNFVYFLVILVIFYWLDFLIGYCLCFWLIKMEKLNINVVFFSRRCISKYGFYVFFFVRRRLGIIDLI